MCEMRISEMLSLGRYMTFQESRQKPIHRWFYYKEGYAPGIVNYAVKREGLPATAGIRLLDPFCGAGTSLLAAKHLGLHGFGVDASELAVFVSRVKCADYSKDDLAEIKNFLATLPKMREPAINWEFELFSPRAAFPRRNLNNILGIRQAITEADCGNKAKDFLLLALLSILPQASIVIKDGGVLKIKKKKRAMPATEAFKKKLRQMISDAEDSPSGPEPFVTLGDARMLDFEDEHFDFIVTSPPYLNNVDYSKVYGLELSLLALDAEITKKTRVRLLHSFIKSGHQSSDIPPECGDIGRKIPVVGSYFADMEKAIKEMRRVLKADCAAYVIVSNAVIFEELIPVDKIFAEIGERHGMDSEIVVGAYRIADVKPQRLQVRESIVILRKP